MVCQKQIDKLLGGFKSPTITTANSYFSSLCFALSPCASISSWVTWPGLIPGSFREQTRAASLRRLGRYSGSSIPGFLSGEPESLPGLHYVLGMGVEGATIWNRHHLV